jgi:hypothetical protein
MTQPLKTATVSPGTSGADFADFTNTDQIAPVNGGLGVDASTSSNGAIPIFNGTTFTVSTMSTLGNLIVTNAPGAITLQYVDLTIYSLYGGF